MFKFINKKYILSNEEKRFIEIALYSYRTKLLNASECKTNEPLKEALIEDANRIYDLAEKLYKQ